MQIVIGKGYYKATYFWITAKAALYCQCCGKRIYKGEKVLVRKCKKLGFRFCEVCGSDKWKQLKEEHCECAT